MKNIIKQTTRYILIICICIIFAILLICCLLLFIGCDEEKYNFTMKENDTITIHLVTKNCGATSGFARKIYLTSKDKDFTIINEPIILLDGDVPNIYWKDKYTLIIQTNSKRIFKFSNFTHINNQEYIIILDYNMSYSKI